MQSSSRELVKADGIIEFFENNQNGVIRIDFSFASPKEHRQILRNRQTISPSLAELSSAALKSLFRSVNNLSSILSPHKMFNGHSNQRFTLFFNEESCNFLGDNEEQAADNLNKIGLRFVEAKKFTEANNYFIRAYLLSINNKQLYEDHRCKAQVEMLFEEGKALYREAKYQEAIDKFIRTSEICPARFQSIKFEACLAMATTAAGTSDAISKHPITSNTTVDNRAFCNDIKNEGKMDNCVIEIPSTYANCSSKNGLEKSLESKYLKLLKDATYRLLLEILNYLYGY